MTLSLRQLNAVVRAIKALGHPLRVSVLLVLADADEPMTPKQLAAELGVPLENLSYHVRVLARLELIKLTRRRQGRRGAVEHLYRLTPDGQAVLDLATLLAARATHDAAA